MAESPEPEREEVPEQPPDTASGEVPASEDAGTSPPEPQPREPRDPHGLRRRSGMLPPWKRRNGA